MHGLKEGGPCVGSQVELKEDMLFCISSRSPGIKAILHKRIRKGTLGTVIHNNKLSIVVNFEGDWEIIFHDADDIHKRLGEDLG